MRSRRIDVRASAAATRRAAGRPVFVHARKPRLPDYPLLLDAQSPGDHLTVLGRSIAARLRREGVHHVPYLYDADPRFVRTDTPLPHLLTLEALAARFDGDVLIVLGDADGFLQPFGAQVEPWVETALSAWRAMVLLTPVPLRRWSWRERRLANAGLVVLPATADGLTMLGDFLRSGERPPRPALERPPARQTLIAREGRSARWLHADREPPPDALEELQEAIALELPPAPYELLCFLALFPELRPDLTLHAAQSPLLRRERGSPSLQHRRICPDKDPLQPNCQLSTELQGCADDRFEARGASHRWH